MYSDYKTAYLDLFFLFSYSWSFGILLWEMATLGKFFLTLRQREFISVLTPHVTLTVNLLLMHYRRYPVSHVHQSRAVSTFEDWLPHGKARHVL